jgi:hypothetical protein
MSFGVLSIPGAVLIITVPVAMRARRALRGFAGDVSGKDGELEPSRDTDSTAPEPISIRSQLPANVIIPKLLL